MTASRAHRAGQHVKAAADATLGRLAVGMLRAIRATSRTRMADFAGGFMRRLGPRLKEHGIGRANLAAAFPDKSAAEIEDILQAVWDNLGRVADEFEHIYRLHMSNLIRMTRATCSTRKRSTSGSSDCATTASPR
jgi:KDO2-lipid IV(A) lauroyltransferase